MALDPVVICLSRAGEPVATVLVGPRVGIDFASPKDRVAPYRFAIAGSPWVSRRRELAPAR